jgi:transcriptional regulator with XRE-family HTH domain
MPRPNRQRDVFAEENLAARITIERERRRWTLESLAARMTAAGCPLPQSAIYKIEQGRPRRRIVVDELVAFSQVFGIPVESLLVDPAAGETPSEQLVKLLERLLIAHRARADAQVEVKRAREQMDAASLRLTERVERLRDFLAGGGVKMTPAAVERLAERPDLQLGILRTFGTGLPNEED